MVLNTSQSVTEQYNMIISESHGRISVKIVQNSSKWPLAGDFQAISKSVGSSKVIADGLYAPHMILNTSQSITERYNTTISESHGRRTYIICENGSKQLKIASRGRFLGYFKVSGELKKDSRWFICTTYDLKYIIEYHRAV